MNSIIEAQETFFCCHGGVLLSAPGMPMSMLFFTKQSEDEVKKDKEIYMKKCDQYIATQKSNLWDYKIKS